MKAAHEGSVGGEFFPLGVRVLVVSDTRTLETDTGGALLESLCSEAGHQVVERRVVPDQLEAIRGAVTEAGVDSKTHAVIVTGGTGLTARDVTPEAITPLLDKHIPGFGELFRMLSWDQIGTSAMESRAFCGLGGSTAVFVIPGSRGACSLAAEKLILPQLDARTRPCSIAGLLRD